MDRIQLKELSKQQLKGHWKIPVLFTLAYFVVTGIASAFQSEASSMITITLTFLLVWGIAVWATVGISKFYLEFLRKDGDVSFKDSLVTSKQLVKSLVYTIIIGIVSAIIGIIIGFTVASSIINAFIYYEPITAGVIIGIIISIVCSVLFIIFTFAVSMAPYIIIEKEDLGAIDAMKLSMNMMKGHKWEYFVLQLSFIGWAILSILTFGIGFLWLVPYVSVATVNYYKKLQQ